jgi:hypothetical protein
MELYKIFGKYTDTFEMFCEKALYLECYNDDTMKSFKTFTESLLNIIYGSGYVDCTATQEDIDSHVFKATFWLNGTTYHFQYYNPYSYKIL